MTSTHVRLCWSYFVHFFFSPNVKRLVENRRTGVNLSKTSASRRLTFSLEGKKRQKHLPAKTTQLSKCVFKPSDPLCVEPCHSLLVSLTNVCWVATCMCQPAHLSSTPVLCRKTCRLVASLTSVSQALTLCSEADDSQIHSHPLPPPKQWTVTRKLLQDWHP